MNLYISDLDGTLLNQNALISDYSKSILSKILKSNINFSIATARTPATVIPLLDNLKLNLPIIVMNGASMYDLNTNTYINPNYINKNLAKNIYEILNNNNVFYFSYSLSNNHIFAYYTKENKSQEEFIKSRSNSPYKTFVKSKINDFNQILYFFVRDKKDIVEKVYEKIKNIKELYLVIYKDVYDDEIYNLEIYNIKSSKANSIKKIMEENNFTNLTTFGDNLNDIPMFELANEGIAVRNAVSELKNIATKIIESNINDGVAKYLETLI